MTRIYWYCQQPTELHFLQSCYPCLRRGLMTATAGFSSSALCSVLHSSPVELSQPVVVCPSGYYSCNLLTQMPADPKFSFFNCLHFPPPTQTQVQKGTVWFMSWKKGLQRLAIAGTSLCWIVEDLMASFSSCDRRIVRESHLLHSPLAMTKAQLET